MYPRAAVSLLLGLLLFGCASVPALVEDPITVKDIVQRVKCEIAYAVPKPEGKWPTGDYQWLRDWTAKVDLTLETDDTGGISPGVSFIDPLPSSQMFSLGLGGGVSTTASRTETMSFTLSVAELRNPHYLHAERCDELYGWGLLGGLGLHEWMQAALAPTVAAGGREAELRIGYHAPPASGAKAAAPPKKGARVAALTKVQQEIDTLNDIMDDVASYADGAQRSANSAQRLANTLKNEDLTKPPAMFYREIQRTADLVAMAQDGVDQTKKNIRLANSQIDAMKGDADDYKEVKDAIDKAKAGIKDANDKISKATQVATAALTALPPNGPVDAIGHQVSFIVAISGNVTPNWTLVRFKGPGTANTGLISASRTLTHTLNISMGSPSNSGIGQVSMEQLRQLDYLHQSAAFRNALTTRSAVAGTPF